MSLILTSLRILASTGSSHEQGSVVSTLMIFNLFYIITVQNKNTINYFPNKLQNGNYLLFIITLQNRNCYQFFIITSQNRNYFQLNWENWSLERLRNELNVTLLVNGDTGIWAGNLVLTVLNFLILQRNWLRVSFFNFSIIADVQYYISPSCILQWLDIYITSKVIAPINLVPIGHRVF